MVNITPSAPILVTGSTGYIASWIVKYLLEDGHTVHATVRSKNNKDKTSHLLDLAANTTGTLKIFEADLLQDGSFDDAMSGCELVIHTASPFTMKADDPYNDLVKPATNGTKNVLEAATRTTTVKRIVLTSSIAAMWGDACEIELTKEGIFTEELWNESSSLDHNPYLFSKAEAEREAWRLKKAQNKWDLVVINPALVQGPSLSRRGDSYSVDFLMKMIDGRTPACADTTLALVDVRDVARAHVLAGLTPKASGRHILSSAVLSFKEIADIAYEKYGNKYPIPRVIIPTFLMKIIGPKRGLSRDYISKNFGISYKVDNSYSVKDLGLKYRPIKDTIIDGLEKIIEVGLVSSELKKEKSNAHMYIFVIIIALGLWRYM